MLKILKTIIYGINMKQKIELDGVKNIIMVVSGKGGVGKSTVSSLLALSMQQLGYKVGLMDADIFGPSIPIMFGIENIKPDLLELGETQKFLPIIKDNISIISLGNFVDKDQAVIWRGPMASKAITDILSNVAWNDLDLLIIDMPPGTSDIHLTITQSYTLNGAVIVTTPQKVACADAIKACKMLKNPFIGTDILGIIENMAFFQTEELKDKKFYIFGKGGGQMLADEFDTKLLGQIPIVENICESTDSGNIKENLKSELVKQEYMNIAGKLENLLNLKK